MEITVLGSGGGEGPGSYLVGFRIGAQILLDAGTVGLKLELAEQKQIRHVLLTHAHLDHVHSLPFLLDNLIGRISDSVSVYSTAAILTTVRQNLFNGEIWPDFSVMPSVEKPVVNFRPIEPGEVFQADHVRAEAIPVNHSVPAVAYYLTDESGTVLFTGDTGPTEMVWQKAAQVPNLRAIFMECSFPNRLKTMAEQSRHLTPADIPRELNKIGRPISMPVYLYHLKPEFREEIAQEVEQLQQLLIQVAKAGDVIRFE